MKKYIFFGVPLRVETLVAIGGVLFPVLCSGLLVFFVGYLNDKYLNFVIANNIKFPTLLGFCLLFLKPYMDFVFPYFGGYWYVSMNSESITLRYRKKTWTIALNEIEKFKYSSMGATDSIFFYTNNTSLKIKGGLFFSPEEANRYGSRRVLAIDDNKDDDVYGRETFIKDVISILEERGDRKIVSPKGPPGSKYVTFIKN